DAIGKSSRWKIRAGTRRSASVRRLRVSEAMPTLWAIRNSASSAPSAATNRYESRQEHGRLGQRRDGKDAQIGRGVSRLAGTWCRSAAHCRDDIHREGGGGNARPYPHCAVCENWAVDEDNSSVARSPHIHDPWILRHLGP